MQLALRHRLRALLSSRTPAKRGQKMLLEMMPRRCVCAEIGVWRGDFSAEVLKRLQPRELHLIDPWRYESDPLYAASWYGGACGEGQSNMDSVYAGVLKRFKREIRDGCVVVHRMSSAAAAAGFSDAYFDWIYVDGNHQYEFVKQDLELFYPKLKAGGFITGDDYENEGWWQGGVRKAVEQFVLNFPAAKVFVEANQFALKKL